MTNLVTCITPDWPVINNVTTLCSTRLGGVSEAPYDSLNLGLHVADNQDAVMENRSRFGEAWSFPSEPLWLNQIHGTDVEVISSAEQGTTLDAADGAWTNVPGRVLSVLTADCLPRWCSRCRIK